MPQFVAKWLIDMLDKPPYRDEREMKAEQRDIRANARQEVDKIWNQQAAKIAPPPPPAPLTPPTWGTAPPPPIPANSASPSTPPTPPLTGGDPGIGVASRLGGPSPSGDAPPPLRPDYWS